MGKHKQAQRVKNNARPSSSGRSAVLLGTSINPFVGFSTSKDAGSMSGVSALSFNSTSFDEPDLNLDVKFQLVFKKMNKKDGTTKLKALHEFTELVKASEPEAVKAILTFWPRIYTCLVVDVEHRVREAVHNAHHAVVVKVKRNLAPFLKQLAGPWFTSQYDTYPPAASAAKLSFEVAFPANKLQEAIAFCQTEILQYICDNICDQTAETLSQSKKLSPEESEAKYERVLISSLQGYTLYLTKMTSEQIEAASEINSHIVTNSKFWTLAKVKSPLIRTAWFGCITALCQNAPFLIEQEAHHAIAAVFSNLDDSEPTVLPATWEAVLLIVTNIKKWWKYVSVEKLVLPKLWKVLREGGQGSATVLYPNILPLVSRFPINVNSSNFYSNLFTSMQQGMKKPNVLQSRSEFSAIITSFVECLRYIIMKNVANINECETLILVQLIPAIEWSLNNKNNLSKFFFSEISSLLHFWYKNIEIEEYKNYKNYTECFWINLKENFHKNLSLNKEDLENNSILNITNKQVELLLCLKKYNSTKKKDVRVKFLTNNEKIDANATVGNTDNNPVNIYQKDLNMIVFNIVYIYMKEIKENNTNELISSLLLLIQEFESVDLFKYLNEHFCTDTTKSDNLINVFYTILELITSQDSKILESVVDIIFILYKYLSEEEKDIILTSLTELSETDCLFWTAKRAICHPYCNDEIVKKWLSSPKVTDLLVKITSTMLNNEITSDKMVFLRQALNQNNSGDIPISQEGCANIVSILCDALLFPSNYPETIDKCASFAAHLSSILYNDKTLLSYGDQLILALFSLSCNNNYDKETITNDTLWEVNTAWQDTVYLLVTYDIKPSDLHNIIWKFAKIIQNNFLNQNSLNDIYFLKSVIVDLIQAVVSVKLDAVTFMFTSLLVLPETVRPTINQIDELCICAELIHGEISWIETCPVADNVLEEPIENVQLLRYMMWYQLVIRVLRDFFSNCDDDHAESEKEMLVLQDSSEEIDNIIVAALHCYSSVICFANNFKNTTLYNQISPYLEEMKHNYGLFVNKVLLHDTVQSENEHKDIIKMFKIKTNDILWAKYYFTLIYDLSRIDGDRSTPYEDLVKNKNDKLSNLNIVQLTQLFAEHISYDNVIETTNQLEKFTITRALIKKDENEIQIAEALTILMAIREKDTNFYNRNISAVNWPEIQEIVEIIRLLTTIIDNKHLSLTSAHWDFVIISLAAWANSVEKSKQNYNKIGVAMFISAFCDLFCSFHSFITNQELVDALTTTNSGFIVEYNDLFAQDIHVAILNLWIYVAENELLEKKSTLKMLPLLERVGNVIFHLEPKFLINQNVLKLQNWQHVLKISCELLKSSEKILQLWGYRSLLQISETLVVIDSESISQTTPIGVLFPKIEPVLSSIQDVIHVMLMEFKLGEDTCTVKPFTDSYTFTLGYLLLWDILLTLCKTATADLRFQYLDRLRSGSYVKYLLNNLFRLMPTEVLHCTDSKKKAMLELFSTKPSLSMSGEWTSECLEHMVCWLYAKSLAELPALVRQWWTDSDPRVAHTVQLVTTTYVSPQLCATELQDVIDREKESKHSMKIKVHTTSREVIAVYIVDEARMELIITLPVNYPLGVVQVDCSKQIGGPTQWRNWVMQLTMFLTHQNGSIWNGLTLWKNNLDKKFDGVEECYICFSVLHNVTYQLPKLVCQTCKKKFHSTCLYKWFSTSNKSTCPICRNLF